MYPTVPSPTLYDVPFSRNTKRYRQTTDRRQTDRTSCHKRDRTTQYGRLKMKRKNASKPDIREMSRKGCSIDDGRRQRDGVAYRKAGK